MEKHICVNISHFRADCINSFLKRNIGNHLPSEWARTSNFEVLTKTRIPISSCKNIHHSFCLVHCKCRALAAKQQKTEVFAQVCQGKSMVLQLANIQVHVYHYLPPKNHCFNFQSLRLSKEMSKYMGFDACSPCDSVVIESTTSVSWRNQAPWKAQAQFPGLNLYDWRVHGFLGQHDEFQIPVTIYLETSIYKWLVSVGRIQIFTWKVVVLSNIHLRLVASGSKSTIPRTKPPLHIGRSPQRWPHWRLNHMQPGGSNLISDESNTGCLIGILLMVCYNHHIIG